LEGALSPNKKTKRTKTANKKNITFIVGNIKQAEVGNEK